MLHVSHVNKLNNIRDIVTKAAVREATFWLELLYLKPSAALSERD